MAKSRGLGRGLDALLGGDEAASPLESPGARDAVVSLRLADIDPNPEQPRRAFPEAALKELAESVRAVGVLQPIIVRKAGARYLIIAGERRFRAARLAGLSEIPAIVRDWDEVKRMTAALVENLQRSDLNPVEAATGVGKLMQQCGLTQEGVAARVGMSRPAVANLLRLLTLPEPVLALLRDGELSAGHARALVPLDPDSQNELATLAVQHGWSVRQLERICQRRLEEPDDDEAAAVKPPADPEFKRLERMARDTFGVRARLVGDDSKGKLILPYSSADDLQRIWDILEALGQNEA